MAAIDEKVAQLEAKLAQAKAEQQKRDARIRVAQGKVRRTADTTAKILLGAASMQAAKKGNGAEWIAYLAGLLSEKDRKRLEDAFATLELPTPMEGAKKAAS